MEQIHSQVAEEPYRAAFATVRAAKNWFWWLVLAAVVVQLGAFVAVRFAGVVDQAGPIAKIVADRQAGDRPGRPVATAPAAEASGTAELWHQVLHWVLPGTKFLAVAAGALLALTLLVGTMLALTGRTGGVAGLTSALFWSLVLLAALIPWQQVLGGPFVSGAMHNFGELRDRTAEVTWGAQGVGPATRVLYYARFVAYPLLAVVLALVVQAKFARGYRRTVPAPSGGNAAARADEKM
jgi:hypothetical protein